MKLYIWTYEDTSYIVRARTLAQAVRKAFNWTNAAFAAEGDDTLTLSQFKENSDFSQLTSVKRYKGSIGADILWGV